LENFDSRLGLEYGLFLACQSRCVHRGHAGAAHGDASKVPKVLAPGAPGSARAIGTGSAATVVVIPRSNLNDISPPELPRTSSIFVGSVTAVAARALASTLRRVWTRRTPGRERSSTPSPNLYFNDGYSRRWQSLCAASTRGHILQFRRRALDGARRVGAGQGVGAPVGAGAVELRTAITTRGAQTRTYYQALAPAGLLK